MTSNARRFVTCCAASFVLTCGGKTKTEVAPPVEQTDPPAGEVARTLHPDPGPTLERQAGRAEARKLPARELAAAFTHTADGYSWAVVPDVDHQSAAPFTEYAIDAAGTHGTAFRWNSEASKNPALVARFVGSLPERFTVHWSRPGAWDGGVAGTVGRYEVTTAGAADRAELNVEFIRSAEQYMQGWAGRTSSSFFNFATARLAARKPRTTMQEAARSDIERTMAFYTGMTSIREALQHDRGLRVRERAEAEPTIDIAELEGVPLPQHPWDEMIAELSSKPVGDELAKFVPHDMAYLHFGDLPTFLLVIDDFEDSAAAFTQTFEVEGGPTHFLDRTMQQLVLERTGVAKTLGSLAAAGVAIVTSDPFLREGSDVSMIFRVANRPALVGALAAFEASARKARPDMTESTWKLGDTDVRLISTPDKAIHRHVAEWDGILVVSNSEGALRHLKAAHDGKVTKLSESGDYRYMRARYPQESTKGEGFLFLSDAFVAHSVSPRVKILESRRLRAQADLSAVNHAALMHGWFEGVHPLDVAAMKKAGWLTDDDLKHFDGTGIAYSPERGAMSRWGRAPSLVPIRDLEIEKVSEEEAEAYARFRESYQQYWSGFIDPIAARIRRTEGGQRLTVDALMMPLIDGTEYTDLRRLVGQRRTTLREFYGGFRWTFAVGDDATLRRELNQMATGLGGRDLSVDWLGDSITVGVADRSGLWDAALTLGAIPSFARPDSDEIAALARVPGYLKVDVDNAVGLAGFLTAARKFVLDSAPGLVRWEASEPYRDIAITQILATEEELGGGLALHYATADGQLLVSLDRTTLQILLDEVLDPTNTPQPPNPEVQSALAFDFSDTSNWLAMTAVGIAEQFVVRHHPVAAHAWGVLRRGFPDRNLDQSATRNLGVAFLGYEPKNPNGGTFSFKDAQIYHTLYGSHASPILPEIPVEGAPLTEFLKALRKLNLSVDFDDRISERHLGLRTHLVIVRD